MKFAFLLFISVLFAFDIEAQIPGYNLSVRKSQSKIIIDGELNDNAWLVAERAKDFTQNFPTDTLPATSQSEIMVSFDDEFLYFAGVCYEPSAKEHIIQSLRRDFNWPQNENLSIYFDPFNDLTNGFTFGITPAGVQREGLVTNSQDVSSDWDNKWYSEVKNFDDRWQFEMAIPFKSIRYDESIREWNIIFLRLDLKNNERSTWVPVPQQYRPSSFAFSGKLNFVDPLKKSGTNVSLIPFVSSNVSKNHEKLTATEFNSDFGFDAKIGVSSSLNLDLTVNPDFSQVEVDRQVTNLSRFEIFFPERRQFFLENSDLFAQNGFRRTRPFFSRRIGIGTKENEDGEDETGTIPILFGARLSGKIGQNWRIGLMNMQTKKSEEFGLPSQNYSVGIIQRKLFTRSNFSFLVVNKQSLNIDLGDTTQFKISDTVLKEEVNGADTTHFLRKYNRVFGFDFNFLSADNRWEGNAYFHKSFTPKVSGSNSSFGLFARYQERAFELGGGIVSVEENYVAEVGFIPRNDWINIFQFGQLNFYPKNSSINRHGPRYNLRQNTDQELNSTDQSFELNYSFQFLNTSRLEFEVENQFVKLRSNFNPTSLDTLELFEGDDFRWNEYRVEYMGDSRDKFSYNISGQVGGYFSGNRVRLNTTVNYRYQPYFNLSFAATYNNIQMPDPYQDAIFWLVGPRFEFTFSDKLFLTTFIQWNDQDENLNLNTRFQWRFKPASDLFLVYTDDYFPESLKVKNRSLVFKLSYWLNL